MVRYLIKTFCDFTGIPRYWVRESVAEFRMLYVRVYGILSCQRLKIKKLVQSNEDLKLLFGCGDTAYDGWVGVDCFFAKNVQIVMDLRRSIPLPDNSVSFCFSEHFISMIHPNEGFDHLQDVYRILRPGGVYRVVVPDAINFARNYIDGNHAFFKKAFPWVTHPIDAVYCVMNWGGSNRNILDFKAIERIGLDAGFNSVLVSSAGNSEYPELRIDITTPQRIAESLYVELTKYK